MPPTIFAALIIVILLSVVIIPLFNARQFNRLPQEQQVRVLMKQANGLVYFKNVSNGSSGTLYYIKNKRKIFVYPWTLQDGKMICGRKDLFETWDYPEEKPAFTVEEKQQAREELEKYNVKHTVKLIIYDESDQ